LAGRVERRGPGPVQDVMLAVLERLSAAGIELLPALEVTTHFIFTRDGFVALVELRGDGFGGVGAAGLLVDAGMAPLVWRGDSAYFVARGFDRVASAEEVESLRKFYGDLKNSLAVGP
jgi:hypothetical protein